MDNVTRILEALNSGNAEAADELVPAAYSELRRLAASKMAHEQSGHTLQANALVHEAWMRLQRPAQGESDSPQWNSRGHFFSAAAEAMRRILIESARRKNSDKRGNRPHHTTLDEERHIEIEGGAPSDRLLAVDEALTKLEQEHAEFAEVVKLRYFAGMTVAAVAKALDTSESTVNRTWKSAKVWLYREIGDTSD